MKRMPLGPMVLGLLGLSAILLHGHASPSRPPDLSGTWNADLAKSRFVAGAVRPKRWFIVIQQDERHLVRTETFIGQNDKSSGQKMTFTLDGTESRNQLDGTEVVTTCRWEGTSLIIEGTMKLSPTESASWEEKLTLSPDGKGLRAVSSIQFPGGQTNDTDITYVRGK